MEKKTSKEWLAQEKERIGLEIIDPDGWDRKNLDYSFNQEEITREEWERRVAASTIKMEWKGRINDISPLPQPDHRNITQTPTQPHIHIEGLGQVPIANIRSQGGLKKEIVDLVVHMPTPDRQCELTDFLMALLDKHFPPEESS